MEIKTTAMDEPEFEEELTEEEKKVKELAEAEAKMLEGLNRHQRRYYLAEKKKAQKKQLKALKRKMEKLEKGKERVFGDMK